MEQEAWTRVEELFQAARAQPPDQRPAFLARSCSGDPELRSEVESLLRAAEDSLLEGSPLSSIEKPSPWLASGSQVGHFEIVGALARGGMGDVYRARDVRLGREVALKILPPVFVEDSGRVARFRHEARAASSLNHPNIVSVFDAGSSDGVFWIASELIEGETLADCIGRGRVPLRKLSDIACQIAAGLTAAHAVGVIHRDLKPANLMLTRDGRVKILDFGLAKQANQPLERATPLPQNETRTLPGIAMGTPGYMSPEQVRGEPADARSDLFSFGAILYEMASGRRAFQGDSSIAVMNAILKLEPIDLPPDVPAALDRIIRRCLEKEPARRFQSASDLGFSLETTLAAPSGAVSAQPRRWRPIAAGFLACALLAAGAYWLRGYFRREAPVEFTNLRQITFDEGLTADPAISPDGKFVAFASDRAGSGNLDIWVKQVDGGDPVQLTNDPASEYDPAFAPDGARIAFRSDRDGGGIYMMPALGGEASLLVPRAWRPRFSPDGKFLLYLTGLPIQRIGLSSAGNQIFVMPLGGGAPVELSRGCSIVTNTPIWSPDGRRVLFPAMCGSGRWDIWAADVNGGLQATHWREYLARFSAPEAWYAGGGLAGWLDHPLRLLVIARAGSANFLQAVPALADGSPGAGRPERITFGTGAETQASVAASGPIAVGSLAYEAHIWGIGVDDSGHAIGSARQLTSELPGEIEPVISEDGRHLVFLSSKLTPPQVYGKDLASGRVRRLSQDTAWVKMAPAIGLGGSEVVYLDLSSAATAIYSVPFAGGVPQKFSIAARTHSSPSDWGRDGKALLLMHDPESASGHFSVHAVNTATGQISPLIEDQAHDVFEAHFSPDARWVTFTVVANGNSRVFAAPFRWAPIPVSEWQPITGDTAWSDKPRFSNDGRSILFSSDRDGFRCIWAQRLSPDMRPSGDPFAVFHSHGSRLSIGNGPLSDQGMSVGKGLLVFDQTDLRGNIWLLADSPHGSQ